MENQVNAAAQLARPWDPLAPWPRARPWIWAALFVLVCFLQAPRFVATLRPNPAVGVDFFQDWASARNFLEGRPIYEDQNVTVERYLGLSTKTTRVEYRYNAHPPASVFLAVPVARLDYPDATLVWNIISLAAFALSIYLVIRQLPLRLGVTAIVPFITLALICSPFRQQCVQGQLGFVMLVLIVGSWAAARTRRCYWAGILLGVAAAIKLFPAFLLLYFCLTRRWKVVASGALTFVAISGTTLVVLGTATYVTYFNEVLPTVEALRSNWINASLPGLWSKLFDHAAGQHVVALWQFPPLAQVLILVSCFLVIGGLAWITRRARTLADYDTSFALAVTAMLLVSPITWDHYLVLLVLPVAVAWLRLPPPFLWRASFLAVLVALGAEPNLLYRRIPGGYEAGIATPFQTLTLLSLQCYGLVGLFALALAEARAWERHPSAQQSFVTA